ncbi:MAG TPA: DUF5615 family PIN-like protein [Pyrinomonadaceae bacterium]|nr:DUF5615 family PIN-like protein [Pyrinomonadaceae bacterium]
MKILLDECVPRALKKRLHAPDVRTAQELGWAGLKNGALLTAANGRFDVFITADKNLRRQQNLARYNFAVVLLPTNQVPDILALIPDIETVLTTIRPGDFVEIPLRSA